MNVNIRDSWAGKHLHQREWKVMALLLALLVLHPILPEAVSASILLGTMLASAWLVGSHSRRSARLVYVLAIPAALCILAQSLLPADSRLFYHKPLGYAVSLMTLILVFYTAYFVISSFFRTREVTAEVIVAALNFYLVLGFGWGVLYEMAAVYNPDAFAFSTDSGDRASQLLYYSFVTLTTLGYGDVTPMTPTAQTLSVLEAIVGKFYDTFVIAYLLGIFVGKMVERKE